MRKIIPSKNNNEYPGIFDSIAMVLGIGILYGLFGYVSSIPDPELADGKIYFYAIFLLKISVQLVFWGAICYFARLILYHIANATESLKEIKSLRKEIEELRNELKGENKITLEKPTKDESL